MGLFLTLKRVSSKWNRGESYVREEFGDFRVLEIVLTKFLDTDLQLLLLIFCYQVVSSSLQYHGLQHARLPSFTISRSLFRLVSTESVMPSNHLIFCRPLLTLPSVFLSIRIFSNQSAPHIRWPKYWSFSFSVSPCSERQHTQGWFSLGLTSLTSLQSKGQIFRIST